MHNWISHVQKGGEGGEGGRMPHSQKEKLKNSQVKHPSEVEPITMSTKR